jgi:(p)ppGpp synthase/HD superfamily hydrolase
MLEKAIEIAVKAHSGQVDKGGQPYILHPLRVMMKMDNDTDRVVAVLHDVIEDTDVKGLDLYGIGFNSDILVAIMDLTKRDGEDYIKYIERVAENPIARRVKLADLDDNMDLGRLHVVEDKDWARWQKYRKAKEYLEGTL